MELNIRNDSDRIQNVPIQCKMTLTIREAAEYGSTGIHKKLGQKSQRKSSRALRKGEGCVIISNRVRFLNGIACQARQQRSCEHI